MWLQYMFLGKTSFTRENRIFGMTESEIENELLSHQIQRPAFNTSSSNGGEGSETYNRSYNHELDFVEEEENIDDSDNNFCETPDNSLFRLSHAGRYSRLGGDENLGGRENNYDCSHHMSMCR